MAARKRHPNESFTEYRDNLKNEHTALKRYTHGQVRDHKGKWESAWIVGQQLKHAHQEKQRLAALGMVG